MKLLNLGDAGMYVVFFVYTEFQPILRAFALKFLFE